MHCLRWWIPIFLIPLPAASPFLTLLFVATYAIRTKPCAYCSVIILGLMFSTCAFYSYAPPSSILRVADDRDGIGQRAVGLEGTKDQAAAASTCWIDLTCGLGSGRAAADEQDDGRTDLATANLGWWSAPTNRRMPTVLRAWMREHRLHRQEERHREQKQHRRGLRKLWSTQLQASPKGRGGSEDGGKRSGFLNGAWRTSVEELWQKGLYVGFGDEAGFQLKFLID